MRLDTGSTLTRAIAIHEPIVPDGAFMVFLLCLWLELRALSSRGSSKRVEALPSEDEKHAWRTGRVSRTAYIGSCRLSLDLNIAKK